MIIKTLFLITIIVLLFLLSFFKDKIKRRNAIILFIALIYSICLFSFTFWGRSNASFTYHSLIPFESYYQMASVRWYGWGEYIFASIVGNVLLFVPLGMIVGNINRINHKYLCSFIAGMCISLFIEITQLVTMIGKFEIDDIINNTWGAIIGCCFYFISINIGNKLLKNNMITLLPLIIFVFVIIVFCIRPVIKEIFYALCLKV